MSNQSTATPVNPTPLTASILSAPESDDGQTAFTFELRFSEEFSLSYKTLRNHAFTDTGGTVEKARRLEPRGNVRWEITVMPDCDGQGAICTEDGSKLSNQLEVTVSGPGGWDRAREYRSVFGQQKRTAYMDEQGGRRDCCGGPPFLTGLAARADQLLSRSCSRLSAQLNRDAVAGWAFRPRPLGFTGSSPMNSAQENSDSCVSVAVGMVAAALNGHRLPAVVHGTSALICSHGGHRLGICGIAQGGC